MTNQALPLLACFNDFELIVFGESLVKISKKFIMAKKNSDILRLLMDKRKNLNKNDIFSWSKILADCNDDFDFNKIVVLDAEKNGFLGEKSLFGVSGSYIYQNCYFKNIVELQEFLQVFQGIVALEESWIPDKYQKLTQEEFLEEDLLISKIFKTLLI